MMRRMRRMNDYDKATLILEKIIEILPGGIHEDEQYMYIAAIENALEEIKQIEQR